MPRLCRGADSRRSALHTLPLRLPGESCPASNRRCKAALNCRAAQVCVWCFHKIRETGNGLCPACRTAYKDENIRFRDQARTTGNDGRAPESSASSRQRSSGSARPGKPSASKASGTGTGKPSATGRAARGTRVRDRKKPTLLSKGAPFCVCVRPSCFGANDVLLRAFAAARRNLANVRVVQRNLVYVVGLAPDIAREDVRRSWLLVVGRLMLTTLGSPFRPCGRTFTLGSTEQS